MQGQALVDYVKRVMDLEKDVYTNQQIQDNFEKSVTQWKPVQPPKPKLERTSPPLLPPFIEDPSKAQTKVATFGYTTLLLAGVLLTCFGVWCLANGVFVGGFVVVLSGIGLAYVGIMYFSERQAKEDEYQAIIDDYRLDMAKYNATIEQVKAENEEKQDQYRLALEDYQQRNSEYIQARKDSYALVTDSRRTLESALNSLYDMGIIYPKYRNLVAISAIYEYLSSGRCNSLDGPNGAYNLYEMELRQNIVIGQLSTIIANLNQIKNNQFTLYNELISANQKSNLLLSDILNNVKVGAYHSEAAAKNAEALKYISLIKR